MSAYARKFLTWGPDSVFYGEHSFSLHPSPSSPPLATAVTFSGLGRPRHVALAMRRKRQGRDNRKDRNTIKLYNRRPGIKEGVVYYVTAVREDRFRLVAQ